MFGKQNFKSRYVSFSLWTNVNLPALVKISIK